MRSKEIYNEDLLELKIQEMHEEYEDKAVTLHQVNSKKRKLSRYHRKMHHKKYKHLEMQKSHAPWWLYGKNYWEKYTINSKYYSKGYFNE